MLFINVTILKKMALSKHADFQSEIMSANTQLNILHEIKTYNINAL